MAMILFTVIGDRYGAFCINIQSKARGAERIWIRAECFRMIAERCRSSRVIGNRYGIFSVGSYRYGHM